MYSELGLAENKRQGQQYWSKSPKNGSVSLRMGKNWRKGKKACMYGDLQVSKRQIKGLSWGEFVQEEKVEGM